MDSSSQIVEPTVTHKKASFEFRGDGMEYFKIWIVNVLLTILTLGIYSAWATVRNNRYFYSNLYLDNTNFSYLAEPLTILKGRVIAVIAFVAFSMISQYDPAYSIVLTVILLIAIPYFVNQSLAFQRRMSAYNNIQFRFKASYFEAFMVFYVWPFLGVLTLGILYPLAMLKMHQYVVKNSAYGTTSFDFNATYGDYGIIFLILLGVGLVFGSIYMAITAFIPGAAFITPFIMGLVYFGLYLYFVTQINNLFFHSLSLKDHRFNASVSAVGLGKVVLINLLLILVTLGLYLPAAKVRMAKYFCDCISMKIAGSLDDFTAAEQENVSALGEEFGQVFDFS